MSSTGSVTILERRGPKKSAVVDVATHPRRAEIEAAILEGRTLSDVSRAFGLRRVDVDRYVHGQLQLALRDSEIRARLDSVEGLRGRLASHLTRIEKLYDACDEYLTDPDNPGKYYLGPRANEVRVVYYTKGPKGERIKQTAMLDEMLALAGEGVEVGDVRFEGVNPRRLVIETANTATRQLEVLAKLIDGAAKMETGAPVTTSEAWVQVQQVIVNIVKDDPAMAALMERLEKVAFGAA